MKNNSKNLLKQRLQEASMGTTMTAERVPSGGSAQGGGSGGGEGGGEPNEGPKNCAVEIECSEGDCEAVCKAIAALNDAGAGIHCLKVDGREYDVATGQEKKEEGGEHGEHGQPSGHEPAEPGEHETEEETNHE